MTAIGNLLLIGAPHYSNLCLSNSRSRNYTTEWHLFHVGTIDAFDAQSAGPPICCGTIATQLHSDSRQPGVLARGAQSTSTLLLTGVPRRLVQP